MLPEELDIPPDLLAASPRAGGEVFRETPVGEFQDGVLYYLNQSLEPKVENTFLSFDDDVEPVPVIAPGGKLE